MSKDQQPVVAVAWYKDALMYQNARSIMSDKDSLPADYADWRELALRNCKMMEAAGNRVQRVMITAALFKDWAKSNGHRRDAQGRHAFAKWMVNRPSEVN